MVVVCLFTLNNLVWANPDLFQRSAPATLAVTPYSHDLSDEKLIETAIKFELEAQPGILEDGKRHHRVPKVFGIPVDIYFH
ncbi:MAG: hypothetical protein PVH45_04885, partial [Candidatus Omnitrophota bacterium]